MSKRKLKPDDENWLFLNFPNKSNRELANELSERMRVENMKMKQRLVKLMDEDFSEEAKKIITRKLEAIDKFSGVSESLIKRYAREMHCPRKSRVHLLESNQKKARTTNLKRWLKKAEKVEHIMEWLRTFDEKDIRYCIIDSPQQLKSFQVSINRFNRQEGYGKGIYLISEHLPDAGLLRVKGSINRSRQGRIIK